MGRRSQLRFRQWIVVSTAIAAMCSCCLGAFPIVTITIPSAFTDLNDGAEFEVRGNMNLARIRNAEDTGWEVTYPNVLCEFFFTGGSMPYLLNSSMATMEFPVATSRQGAWNTNLTATQMGSFVSIYLVEATALGPFNVRTDLFHSKSVYVVSDGG